MKIQLQLGAALVISCLCLSSCKTTTKIQPERRTIVLNETDPLSVGTLPPSSIIYNEESKRKIIYRDQEQVIAAFGYRGKATTLINFCVDTLGIVTYAEINQNESTEKRAKVQGKLLKAFWNYRFEKDTSAPLHDCGTYRFDYDIKISGGGVGFR